MRSPYWNYGRMLSFKTSGLPSTPFPFHFAGCQGDLARQKLYFMAGHIFFHQRFFCSLSCKIELCGMQGATSTGGQEPAMVTSAWLSEPGLQLILLCAWGWTGYPDFMCGSNTWGWPGEAIVSESGWRGVAVRWLQMASVGNQESCCTLPCHPGYP